MALSEPKCSAGQEAAGGREEQHTETGDGCSATVRRVSSHLHDTYLFLTCILYAGFRAAFPTKFFAVYSAGTKLQAFLGIEYLKESSRAQKQDTAELFL